MPQVVEFSGRGSLTVHVIESNSCVKSSDVQSGPKTATILCRDCGSGVGLIRPVGRRRNRKEGYFWIDDL